MKQSDIKRLIYLVTKTNINGYDYDYEHEKEKPCGKPEFIKLAKAYLRMIAEEMGLKKGEYEIRVNMGGVAVSGDITLHTDMLYVDFSQSALCESHGFMYRSCKGREDFKGGMNRWMKWQELVNPAYVRQMFLCASQGC